MPLLLEGDEQEDMVRRYLWRGRLYAGYEAGALVAVCVVTEEDGSTVEIKNLAVHRDFRRRGFGRRMLLHVESAWPGRTIRGCLITYVKSQVGVFLLKLHIMKREHSGGYETDE